MERQGDIIQIIDEKIELARDLIEKLQNDFIHIDGARKTQKNIQKEKKLLEFLKNNCDENTMLKLKCTNLIFYKHLVNSLYKYQKNYKIQAIQKYYSNSLAEDHHYRILIHIVCGNDKSEQLWVKIVARDPEGLDHEVEGDCKYGHKDVILQGEIWDSMAQAYPSFGSSHTPIVIFDFFHQIDEKLEMMLEDTGVMIGHKFRAQNKKIDTEMKLNIDVSTMIAYVSELSNGGTNFTFNDKFLDMQAEDERANPLKPVLEKHFEGKKLIACETAIESFKGIIEIIGGENEKKRAKEFIERLEVLPDVDENILRVGLTGKIKERSRKIFGFGIFNSAQTLTSNAGFARSLKEETQWQVPMILHSARALTEIKQNGS